MTDDEKKMLREMHDTLFKPRIGKKTSLIEDLVSMSDEYRNAKWSARLALLGVLTLGSIFAAWDKIRQFVLGG